jgi:small conductance mechanosensitive channel
MNQPVETLQQTETVVMQLAVQYGPRIVSAVLILIAGYFVTTWVGKLAGRGLGRFSLEPPIRELLVRLVTLLLAALVLLIAAQNLGIELLPLIAGLGIAGAAIALALQGVLGNVAAGLTIIFTRPYRVGEYISIAGEEGEVQSISLFSTMLRHADKSLVVIPNRKIAGEILHNYGAIRQLDLKVPLSYAADLEAALAAIRDVVASNGRVLAEPTPVIQAAQLGALAISVEVRPWVTVPDYTPAVGEINEAIVREFGSRGLSDRWPAVQSVPLPPAGDLSGPGT